MLALENRLDADKLSKLVEERLAGFDFELEEISDSSMLTIEVAAFAMSIEASARHLDGERRRPHYWVACKEEFRKLLCTDDSVYAPLRKKLASQTTKSQTVISSTIAAAVASQLGVVAGALVPFVVLCLLAVAKVGTEAFCKTTRLPIPVRDAVQPRTIRKKGK
jgi:hypothetical protein